MSKESAYCCACGLCCELYGHTIEITQEDRQLLESAGRFDVLDWIRDGRWCNPKTGEQTDYCPFYANSKCSIHEVKPKICREYPKEIHKFTCVAGKKSR